MREDFWRAERLLAFSPHPDDAELGCGGTLFRMARAGAEVHLAVATDGRLGTRDPAVRPVELARLRALEQQAAAARLGLSSLTMFGLPDGGPLRPRELAALAVREIRRLRPQWVLVCDPWLPYEAHADHREVGLAVAQAALLSGLPHYLPQGDLPAWTVEGALFYFPGRPDVLSPLDEAALRARREAIACHASQFSADDPYLRRLEEQLRRQGEAAGALCAEALHLRLREDLHIPAP